MNWLKEGLLLAPWPQEIEQTGQDWRLPPQLTIGVPVGASAETRFAANWLAEDLYRLAGVDAAVREGAGEISLALGAATGHAEGYTLEVTPQGAAIVGDDEAGLAHGCQTLAQLAASEARGTVPGARVRDWPQYALRAVMLDVGRAPHPRALLERSIRIMARLKLNALHLHLHDDELNGVRYATLPLGSENPGALPIAEYGELIRYARRYHVHIIPELEAWGHVSSLVYHYPQTYGATGEFGQSFGFGEATYDLLERMFAEWVPLLGEPAILHVGLDEADAAVLADVPPERRDEYTPVTHIQRLYDILQRLGAAHGKRIEMHLWADHGGRPIPEALQTEVVTEPWMYHVVGAERIRQYVAKYGGEGKTPFMMGAGASFVHEQGVFAATRVWCREAKDAPNCRGVTICIWGSNDVGGRLVSVFAGADYAWSPETPEDPANDPREERLRGDMVRRMKYWQARFPDADPAAIDADRGPEAQMGRWRWGALAGQPCGPTADWESGPAR